MKLSLAQKDENSNSPFKSNTALTEPLSITSFCFPLLLLLGVTISLRPAGLTPFLNGVEKENFDGVLGLGDCIEILILRRAGAGFGLGFGVDFEVEVGTRKGDRNAFMVDFMSGCFGGNLEVEAIGV